MKAINLYLLGHAYSHYDNLTHHVSYSYRYHSALEHVKQQVLLHVVNSWAKWQDGYQK